VSTKARAVVQIADRTYEIQEFALPVITADEALLRVEACGMCGSDVEQYDGKLAEIGVRYPLVPGHEPIGVIEEIGQEASKRWNIRPGDRVAVEPVVGCGYCRACLTGKYRRCTTGLPGARVNSYGFVPTDVGSGLWGGYAEYMYLHPRTVVHKLSAELPLELAALYQPLAAGIRWFTHETAIRIGDAVVVLGAGQRGLAGIIAARHAGAALVIVTGLAKDGHKLELAKRLGADATITVDTEDTVERVMELTGGMGADIVVDVSAVATQPILDATSIVRTGGTIVLAGIKGSGVTAALSPDLIAMREITLKGVYSADATAFAPALQLIESRKYPLEKLHTHTFGLDGLATAVETLAGRVPGEHAVHVMVEPSV
jgi:threonine dehydrogenase-like Zn-dependent dehydrogenase